MLKITALVENTAGPQLKARHGLSLYITTDRHKILFDLGPDDTLFKNARTMGLRLGEVDTVIISHGHADHGGALAEFLKINKKAKIYIQKKAFEPHYTKVFFIKFPVGINKKLANHPQIVLTDGDYVIDDELSVFVADRTDRLRRPANDSLYSKSGKDDFLHEQNLIIHGEKNAVIMGCGHSGVANIMEKAKEYRPRICVGGFHLYDPVTGKVAPSSLLDDIARELKGYKETRFYTCHCTGKKAYRHLSDMLENIRYLSCGDSINL